MTTLTDFSAVSLGGAPVDLTEYAGKVVVVVNTASRCGFTPQYAGLERLHQELAEQGLVILGFPCDQFGNQEPGSEAEIGEFCEYNYGVSFPMFSKVDVNGAQAHPLYAWLRSEASGLVGDKIRWNFTKFLIGRDGTVLKRYAPTTDPAKMRDDILAALRA